MTLIRHELRRAWKSLLIWTLALGGFLVICLAIYPDMKKEMDSISSIMSAMGAFSAAFGMDTSTRADLSVYADAGEISDWAKDAMSWAVAMGLVEGRTADTIVPGDNATRAEAVTLLMRVLRTVMGLPD